VVGVACGERHLLGVGPALELLLSGDGFGARGEGLGVDELDGAALGGPGRAFSAIVGGDAIGQILAGSGVERAVGAAQEVDVEQCGDPGRRDVDFAPIRLRAGRKWTFVPFDSLRSLRTFDSSPLQCAAGSKWPAMSESPLRRQPQRGRVEWSRGDSNPRAETAVRTCLRAYPPIHLGSKTAGGGVTSGLDRRWSRASGACQPFGASPMEFEPHPIGRRVRIGQPVN